MTTTSMTPDRSAISMLSGTALSFVTLLSVVALLTPSMIGMM